MKNLLVTTAAVATAQYIPFDLYNLTATDLNVDLLGRSQGGLTPTGDNRDKIASMLYYRLETSGLESVPFYADMLQYGCWCQLLTDHWKTTNRGAPVDVLDSICRKWNKCNQCSSIDYAGCVGFEQDYGQPLIDQNTLNFSCDHLTDTKCSKVACQCDVALVDELSAFAQEYDPSYSSGESSFDVATCERDSYHSTAKIDSCCGEYPNRFPFSRIGILTFCLACHKTEIFIKLVMAHYIICFIFLVSFQNPTIQASRAFANVVTEKRTTRAS